MSTSGGSVVNALLYVLELVLAIQLAEVLSRVTSLRNAFGGPAGRRRAAGAAALWMVVAVPSLLQIPFPPLYHALRRDPELIRSHGQVWRVLTSLVVQDGGLPGTVFNLLTLALIAAAAVLVWGPVIAIVLFVAAHLVFNVMATFVSSDIGAGNSGATFGLAATIAGLALVRFTTARAGDWSPGDWTVRDLALLGRALGVVLIGAVLVVLDDAHGIPMIGGVLLGAGFSLLAPGPAGASHAEPGRRRQ